MHCWLVNAVSSALWVWAIQHSRRLTGDIRCCELLFNNTRPIVNMLDFFIELYDRPSPSVSLSLRIASVMELRASLLSPPLPCSYAADLSILFFPLSLQGTASISERERSALFVCRCRHRSYLVCAGTYIESFYRRREIAYTDTHKAKQCICISDSVKGVFRSKKRQFCHLLLSLNPL